MRQHFFRKISRSAAITLAAVLAACGTKTRPVIEGRSSDTHVVVAASDLASAFEESESHASAIYTGRQARITGVFGRAESLGDGRIALIFKISKDTFRPVHCVLDATATNGLDNFSSGDAVTVIGEIRGFAESRYFVTVEGCAVE